MHGLMKWPLILAAVLVILRVVLEQAGAPQSISNLSSVVILYLVAFPIYAAVRIGASGTAHPYRSLLKNAAIFAVLARAMVIPTYWLAYLYQWPAPRFSVEQGGVVGPGVTPLFAFVVIPLVALVIWTVTTLIIGGLLGSAVLWFSRRRSA